ncbi:hypothetical protein E3N88_27729 [Mikania micrantha]|uniref:Uncharacterized protein n=1 Tax=Mikania micrantha TaxID=192012 RepID=A0A5N6MXK1_9ASTR|nr:hypothetical protein E3N88_27729 [Mikania micrantha]
MGPVTEAVKKRKWAIPDDESDNWSNDVLEFYQNGDSTYFGERIDIWNDQCFAPRLNLKSTQPDGQLIHAMLLHQVPVTFDPEFDGIAYLVGGPDKEVLRFGPREFCIITGFKFGDNSTKSKGVDLFFNRVLDENISLPITVNKLKTFLVENENNFNDDDIVRLCLLLILYSFSWV